MRKMANENFGDDVINTFGQNSRMGESEHPAKVVFSQQFKKDGSAKVTVKLSRYWDRDAEEYGSPVLAVTASQPGTGKKAGETQWVSLPAKSEELEELSQWLHEIAAAVKGAPIRDPARVDRDFAGLKAEVARINAAAAKKP